MNNKSFLLFFLIIISQFELHTESWYQKIKNKTISLLVGKKDSWKPFHRDDSGKIHLNYKTKNIAGILLLTSTLSVLVLRVYNNFHKKIEIVNLNNTLGYCDPFKNSERSKKHFFDNICKIQKNPSSPMFYIVPATFLAAGGLTKLAASSMFKVIFTANPYIKAASFLAYLPGILYTTRYFPENMFLAKIYKLLHFNNPDQIAIAQLKTNKEEPAKSAWYKKCNNKYNYEGSKTNTKSKSYDEYIFIHGGGARAKGPKNVELHDKNNYQLIMWEGGISTDMEKTSNQIANALINKEIKLNNDSETQFMFYSYGNTVGIKGIERYINDCEKKSIQPFPSGVRIIMAHPALEKEAANSAINIMNKINNCKVFSINSPGDNIGSYNPFAIRKISDFGGAGVSDFALKRKIEKLSPEMKLKVESKIGYITPLSLVNSNSENINNWDKKFLHHKVFSLEEPRKPFIDFLRKNENDLIGKSTTIAIHNTMENINKIVKEKNPKPIPVYNEKYPKNEK
jgi:hypothetical protein